jgi:HK97 family phage major capsid protein
MSSKIYELQNLKSKLIADCTQLVESGLKTPEDRESYKKMLKETDEIQWDLDALARIERTLPSLPAPVVVPVAATPESREQRRAKLNGTFRAYLQGTLDQRIPEHRDLLTSSDGAGGAAIPVEFSGFLSETLKLYAPLFDYANVRLSPDGRSVKICRVDDSSHGLSLIAEGVTLSEVDPTFSSTVVSADPLSSGLVRYSNQLLSDSAFDLEQLLKNLTSSRIGRGVEKALTLGTDVAGTALPNNPGLVSLSQIASTTSTIAAGIGWADITNLFDALDAAYLPRAIFQMSSKTRNYLAGLKTSDGRPFFTPTTDGGLDYLLGKPIVINQSLPSPTAGVFSASVKPVIFGSLFDGLQVIASKPRVAVLRERFAEVNESALVTSIRIGSASLQAGAIQALRIAAA